MRLEDRAVDTLAEGVSRATGAALLVADAPRALIDLNRAPEELDWTMLADQPVAHGRRRLSRRAAGGLGLVPRRMAGAGEIWKRALPASIVEQRLEGTHAPYHTRLGAILDRLAAQWGAALLIDLHSMPPVAQNGPEFVIGDRFGASCDHSLTAAALASFARDGRRAAHNRPYAGGYVLDRHGDPSRGRHALQIEVCRSLYLDGHGRDLTPRAGGVIDAIASLVRALANETASLGRGRTQPLAAE